MTDIIAIAVYIALVMHMHFTLMAVTVFGWQQITEVRQVVATRQKYSAAVKVNCEYHA